MSDYWLRQFFRSLSDKTDIGCNYSLHVIIQGIILIVYTIIAAFSTIVSTRYFWAGDAMASSKSMVYYSFAILLFVVIGFYISSKARYVEKDNNKINFTTRKIKSVHVLGVILITASVLWLLRVRYLTGDAPHFLNLYIRGNRFPDRHMLSGIILSRLQAFLESSGLSRYAAVVLPGCLAGGVIAGIMTIISKKPVLSIIMFFSVWGLFGPCCGVAEVYPMLLAVLWLFIHEAFCHMKGGGGNIRITLTMILLQSLHPAAMPVWPAYLYLISKKSWKGILSFAIVISVIFPLYYFMEPLNFLYSTSDYGPPGEYLRFNQIAGVERLMDIFNLIMIIGAPVLGYVLVEIFYNKVWKERDNQRSNVFLMLIFIGYLSGIWLFRAQPNLPCNVEEFTMPIFPVCAWLLFRLRSNASSKFFLKPNTMIIFLVSGFIVSAFWWGHLRGFNDRGPWFSTYEVIPERNVFKASAQEQKLRTMTDVEMRDHVLELVKYAEESVSWEATTALLYSMERPEYSHSAEKVVEALQFRLNHEDNPIMLNSLKQALATCRLSYGISLK